MTSNLSITDFYKRLDDNVRIGDPISKASPSPFDIFSVFEANNKLFYGEFDKSYFRFTENNSLNQTRYIIEGTYSSKDDTKTEVIIKIKEVGYMSRWLIILPIIGIIFLNIYLSSNHDLNKDFMYIFINLLSLLLFIPFIRNYLKKKMLLSDFYEYFEIIV